jgi:magnesium chelatase subunit I
LRLGEPDAAPRICDLDALAASTSGKVELDTIDDDAGGEVFTHLVRAAVLTVFRSAVPLEQLNDVVEGFEEGAVVSTGDDVASADYVRLVEQIPALRAPVQSLTGGDESAAVVASAVELVLEGLHLSKRLNKDAVGLRADYRSRR